jgi:thymidylate kinase
MLIAFTGCDGCGKSTLVRRAEEWLRAGGVAVHTINKWQIMDRTLFPECRFIGGSIDDFRESVSEMEGAARTLLALWPIMITAQNIERRRAQCDVFLADGYWMKVAAAELAYEGPPALINACIENMRKPDLTLFLDASPEQTLKRKIAGNLLTPYECGRDADLSHEKYLDQQEKIRTVLRQWAHRYSWQVISAEESADQVWERVRNILEAHLCRRQILSRYPTRERTTRGELGDVVY